MQEEEDEFILEEEEQKKGFLKKMYNKTIIPELVETKRAKNRRKREEAKTRAQIQADAREEALQDLQPELKEHYKQQELEKMKEGGKSKMDKLKKFGEAFSLKGTSIGSTEKINELLGTPHQRTDPTQETQQPKGVSGINDKLKQAVSMKGTGLGSDEKINQMLGLNQQKDKKKKDPTEWV